MAVSKFLLKTAAITLDTLFKASAANIKVHGEENIPDQPVLYVINHFTRIETTFLPYIINKYTGKYPLSLAHHSFFSGGFGKFMGKLGAISTSDPERDKILTSALLNNDMPVIIFPEGQMLKDKKLIEKGKYMVYNTGIRRPPHTGSARLALLSQFYREKMKYFFENGYTEKINKYKEYFNLNNEDIENIIKQETLIIPVNITYYPIRAKNNAINRLVEKFIKEVSERLEEELEVEGTMLLEGVDIDINFGKPISSNEYLGSSGNAIKRIADMGLYLEDDEIKKKIPFKKISVNLMYKYMNSIYDMTTINHDHIFSYILTKCKKRTINEKYLKNRAYLAIDRITGIELINRHSSLDKNQFHLLTDDEYEKFNSFIEAVKSDGLVTFKNGNIIKHKDRFNRVYKFHTIRKDNITEVLKNEIEPMKDIINTLKKVTRMPQSRIRRKIRNQFVKLDKSIFKKDYKKYFVKNETKPENIGQPFFLKSSFNKKGIILIHGYMSAPEEIRVLADYLFKKGYSVYGARLRGHGTAPEDLDRRNWKDWYNSVNRAYIIMDNYVKNFVIGGFSTGAGLALLQAANKGNSIKGVVSINAPLRLKNIASNLSSAVVLWNTFLNKIHVEKGKMEFFKNDPENAHINYSRNPIKGVRELGKLMSLVEKKLPDINIPVLIIQGSDDPVVNPVSGPEIFKKIGTEDKEIYSIYSNRHGIVRGKESEKVFAMVAGFLDELFRKN